MASLSLSDLSFILQQIRIAEANASGTPLSELVTDPFQPFGLRTVDGSYNNLLPGQSEFGAADNPFQVIMGQLWRDGEDNPNVPGITPTSYSQTTGTVYDSQPRTISNLIVDQTANNPAAILAALEVAGVADPQAELASILNAQAASSLAAGAAADAQAAENAAVAAAAAADAAADATQLALDTFNGVVLGDADVAGEAALLAANAAVAAALAAQAAATTATLADATAARVAAETARDLVLAARDALVADIDNNLPSTLTALQDALTSLSTALVATQTSETAAVTASGNADIAATNAAQTVTGLLAPYTVVSPGLDGLFGTADDTDVLSIPATAPDEGLSAPFNSWMTLFGQFFDHGLDLINKGGNGSVRVLLGQDDPLYNKGLDGIAGTADDLGLDMQQGTFDDPVANFMSMTRATLVGSSAGLDGVLGDNPLTVGVNEGLDDVHYFNNQTTPFVDQNQTYTSHPSHQVFLREYVLNGAGDPVATGKLLDGAFGGLPTWAEVKAQAADLLGIQLTDADIGNLPMVRTDAYGKFIPGADGYAQLIIGAGTDGLLNTSDDLVVEGDPLANGGLGVAIPSNVIRTNHAFLDDIAHLAAPVFSAPGVLAPDSDSVVGYGAAVGDSDPLFGAQGNNLKYDDELLNAHFITGDGRGNENIGLTTVHHVFHSEHNRQVDEIIATLMASGDSAVIAEWQLAPGIWDGERLFQAARFATEMQYQHLVFEEFARKVSPMIDEFLAPIGYDTTINPAILSEFANVVYRFGHSMLTETIDRYDPNFNLIDADPLHPGQTGSGEQIGLIAAFLNPLAFTASGVNAEAAAGAIVRGMTRQAGNEIDEFVTEALRNNLVGLPLDLATLNIARARDTGVPSLNAARQQFFDMTQDSQLKAYTSWVDFAGHLKHEASVVNFIAAYGTHASITAESTVEGKRAAALAIVTGASVTVYGEPGADDDRVIAAPVDRLDFLNATNAYAGGSLSGLNNVDLWIGGLAEQIMPFGGFLGSTFNFVFETQLENLQNGDRFYYLSRTAGLDFASALENNSFAKLIMLNTNATHLPADVFATPAFTLEVNAAAQFTGIGIDGREDPTGGTDLIPLVIRDNPQTPGPDSNYLRYTGEDHVVLGGTDLNDTLIASIGDDTIYGDAGNDRIEGGDGNDNVIGGDGDDIITDKGGDDVLKGEAGNDVIQGGNGINILFGDTGQDFIITGEDISTTFAGAGNDFVLGSLRNLETIGGAGNDWLEVGHQEGSVGDTFDATGQDLVAGHDVFVGAGEFEDIITEGGDDIVFGSDGQEKVDGASGFDWMSFKFDTRGVTADLALQVAKATPATPSTWGLLDLYAFVEGLSGSAFSDVLRGDNTLDSEFIFSGAQGSALDQAGIERIAGLQQLLGAGVTSYSRGNILLGGDGSDIMEGRRGDDLIDGDAWLNARISVRSAADHNVEIRSVDSMRDLLDEMLSGAINPGQLEIVREIKTSTGPDYDTARFTGARANYTISTAFDGTTTVTDDVGTILGTDGTDTLRNIERLQFSDVALQYNPTTRTFVAEGSTAALRAINLAPTGQLEIRDAVTNAADNTPQVNQVLTVFAGNVTDGNIIAGGGLAANKPMTFYWQVERGLNSGYWEDVVIINDIAGAAGSASGITFQVPTLSAGLALDGLRLRVRGEYQDDNGVLENVFSAPTTAVSGVAPVAPPVVTPAESPTASPGVHLIRSDLQFILDQIIIAERHAAGEDLLSMVGNERLPGGLRTVDGSYNNLVSGQSHFGAADQAFPSLTDQLWRSAEDNPNLPGDFPTSYGQVTGSVYDSQPRTISNLIVDQTVSNPAAYEVAFNPGVNGTWEYDSAGADRIFGTTDDITSDDVLNDGVSIVDGQRANGDRFQTFQFSATAPDEGLSAPFNSWMTLFGQFFDHGLDLINKGGNGSVVIQLSPDDPLYVPGSPTNFMTISRASIIATDTRGTSTTADDIHYFNNQTTPFVDQNQTYTSHPSHQVFLREYALDGSGHPVSTGNLLDGAFGGLPTWAEVKLQAAQKLGIQLSDADITNLPLLRTDAYGNFIPGTNGFAQIILGVGGDGKPNTADDLVVEGNPGAPVATTGALRTNHAFLDDIAHLAAPVFSAPGVLAPDADSVVGYAGTFGPQGNNLQYDDELLNEHFITGDGRGNENIGLTTVHHIFHAEHNRLVDHIKDVIAASNDPAFVDKWHLPDGSWDGERLFQAARFATEMQYQHLVFEEFARTVQPQVDLFFAAGQVYDTTLNPAILSEFANVVYRFGHSMLTETIDRYNPDFSIIDGDPNVAGDQQIGLIQAFLNPLAFVASGTDAEAAAGAIVRGMTRQVGNEIDEFVTEALRNNLVGLPLDLAAINIARARDTGVPSLNGARAEFFSMTGDSQLAPYTSWVDFAGHLKHETSVINFIAAYGTHASITSETTLEGKRAAALSLVAGGPGAPTDRLDFLNATGAYAGGSLGGLNNVDLWIGGLAEAIMPFGGLLGSTFNFVFETQMESLQDADRFYYLERTAGLNFLTELEGNSFAKLIMANTNATHLPGNVFSTPAWTLEVDQAAQYTGLGVNGRADPVGDPGSLTPLVTRDSLTNSLQYTGEDHVVLGGTSGNDILTASIGDDTLYGDDGDDRLEGGDGVDMLLGGAGDDIITDLGGDDVIQGGDGNDAIQGGNGINLIIGGFGQDFINSGEDPSEMFGGPGNDFLLGSRGNEQDMGNEGDDWLEHGNADGSPGDNFDPFGRDQVIGNDVYIGNTIIDIMNAEGGDDIMVGNGGQQDHYLGASGFDWADYKDNPNGVVVFVDLLFEAEAVALGANPSTLDRYFGVEGISGSQFGDYLAGSDHLTPFFATSGFTGSLLTNFGLIDGLNDLVAPALDPLNGPEFNASSFAGEILLGGDGSDFLKGGWGNEIIDGDAWLNVQIGVYDTVDANNDNVADRDADGLLVHGALLSRHNSMTEIQDRVFSGEINPSQLGIIREIRTTLLNGDPTGPDVDTVVFSGIRADYNLVQIAGLATLDDYDDDVFLVTDIFTGLDGVDIVSHVERLQFADETVPLAPYADQEPINLVTVTGTVQEDQVLTASIADVVDLDNVSILNPTGAITGPVTYYWQIELANGFVDIIRDNGVTLGPVTGPTFSPTDEEVGNALRVRAVYKDANGVVEEVFSAPTDAVLNVNDAPVGIVAVSDPTPTETQALVALAQFTDADLPIDIPGAELPPVLNFQWQQANDVGVGGGLSGGFSDIVGATLGQFTPGLDQVNRELRVVVSYIDGQGTPESLTSAATIVTGNFISTAVGQGATALADVVSPTSLDPLLQSTEGQDVIFGGGGADTIDGAGQDDIIDGGIDDDIILAGQGNDSVVGGTGADIISGDAGADVISGDAGNDILDGGSGNDVFNYEIGDGADVVNGGADTDALNVFTTGTSNQTVDLVFDGTVVTSVEAGSIGNVEAIHVDLGANTAAGDTISYALSTAGVTVNLETLTASGLASIAGIENAAGGSGGDTLIGDATANVLSGNGGADALFGNVGNDTLAGGAGNDTLTGGDGLDIINGGGDNDTVLAVIGDGDDVLDGSSGIDTYDLSATTRDAVVTVDTAISADIGVDSLALNSFENIVGSQGNDTITLGTGSNVINGGSGRDTITGGASNDTLIGGTGNDVINYTIGDGADAVDGGTDTDTLNIAGTVNADVLDVIYAGAVLTTFEGGTLANVESVTADLAGGVDTLSYAGTTAALTVNLSTGTASGFSTITGIENVTGGTNNDTLTGDLNVNVLSGGDGEDTLDGGLANDSLVGGAGNDTYIANDGDVIVENPGAANGTDVVLTASNSFTLAANVENLVFTGAGAFTGNGNASANSITGGSGNDTLAGLGGNDTLNGLAGDDTVTYTLGDGADVVDGGADIDTLAITGTAAADTLDVIFNGSTLTLFEGGSIANVEAVQANLLGGTDTLSYAGTTAAVTVNLLTGAASGFASITGIENVTGGNGADTLTGDAGTNSLNGGSGNDTIEGGASSDTLTGGTNIDTVSYAGATAAVTVALIAGAQNTVGAGTDTLSGFENMTGSAFGDTLTGDGGVNLIAGGTGADVLNGAGDADTLLGEAGNDTLNGGTGADTLNGGDDNDTLNGDTGVDTLNGGAGNDVLNGGAGNEADTLNGDAGNDTFSYAMGDGADSINGGADSDTLNISGAAASEQLDVILLGGVLTAMEGGTLTSMEAVTANLGGQAAGTGDVLSYAGTLESVNVSLAAGTASGFSSIANIESVIGGSGADTLAGALGVVNTLTGGNGDDTFVVHDTGDIVSELGGAGTGIDIVNSLASSYTISDADVENLSFIGTGNFTGTGNASANVVTGSTGLDTLNGANGNDVLNGGDNNDTLNGDNQDDTLNGGNGLDVLNGGADNDTLNGDIGNDTLNGGAGIDVLNGGNDNDTLNGDAGNDTLDGGAGTDTLNGGANADIMTGGLDDDIFLFGTAISDISSGTGRDAITDFAGAGVAGGDVINLLAIDANTAATSPGDQAFAFIGTGAFTALGQLRYSQDIANNITIVEGNVSGGLAADFQLQVNGLHTFIAGDFVL